jgi:GAF domain-containing protein
MDRSPELEAVLTDLGRAFERTGNLDGALHEIARVSSRVVPGADDASVTLWRDSGPYTFATTSDYVTTIDQAQYATMSGPCVDAARTGQPFVVDDMGTESRWPAFARTAVHEGVQSSLSLPLLVGLDVIGSLNLYGHQPFTAEAQQIAGVVASYGGLASVSAVGLAQVRAEAENLRAALTSRATIDRAVGIIMSQQQLNQDEAFAALSKMSQHSNRKLRDIAAALVASFDERHPGGSGDRSGEGLSR